MMPFRFNPSRMVSIASFLCSIEVTPISLTRSSSSLIPMWQPWKGKNLRLLVHSVEPATPLAQPDRIVLIKTSDTKASALLTGDIVTFRCRAQYKAVAAVRENEDFYPSKVATWELDYCRLATPVISIERE